MLGCLNHMGDPSENCTGCYAVLLDEVNELKAEITKLRDSDAANLRTIQDARKALGLPPVGCQPGDKVDAGLVAEVAKLREDRAKTIRKAWFASGSWNLGGMRPNLQEYLKLELGE